MDPSLLHLIVTIALTLACAVVTAIIWSRAQVKTVFWWIGLCLLPVGLYLLGLAPAVEGAVVTLTAWAAGLVFTPLVWTGVVLGGLGTLLMVGSRLIPSESAADRRAARKDAAASKASGRQVATADTPRAVSAGRPATGQGSAAPQGAADAEGDFDEIAELLRKRGIN